jgi:hypothetical protein
MAPKWTVPDKPAAPARADAAQADGYRLQPVRDVSVHQPSRSNRVKNPPRRASAVGGKASPPMADGLLPTLELPETSWLASVLYPLRGAESLAVVGCSSAVFWIFLTLVPEYCLAVMADAEMMGTPTMGRFVSLISVLPAAFLLPFAVFYWLQYLGRVLVASAVGETAPPRSPDRNFDGFFNGLSPWLTWLALGGLVGLLPFLGYYFSLSKMADASFLLAAALVLVGLPYGVMALMMAFLHDDPAAATPWGVAVAMLRLGASYGVLCGFVAAAGALAVATFLIALSVRAGHFWIYLVLCLGCWVVAVWISVVVMRVLGTYYHGRKETLRWHHERPRWGVVWKL